MKSDFLIAVTQVCAEKNISREVVFEALETALLSAYKRSFGMSQGSSVKILPNTGEVKVYAQKEVVEEVLDERTEISLRDARRIKPDAELEDLVEVEATPANFGRIAAQTAKQVVFQRLREAEREVVFGEFADKEGDIVSGIIQRVEPRQVIIDLGRAEGILGVADQVPTERYKVGRRLRVYLLEVHRTSRGPQLVVSRTHRSLLRRLFELEVPEIFNGQVEIKAIARDPGLRSKVAVVARQDGIDPVGACVGLRGIRIQNIVNELDGEKIDVIQWHADPAAFVANALSPAQVLNVRTDPETNTAKVVVPDRQLSLAIGKEGLNARLAARLTGWRIDIKGASLARAEEEERAAQEAAKQAAATAVAEVALAESPAPETGIVEVAAEAPSPIAAEPVLAGVEEVKAREESKVAEESAQWQTPEEWLAANAAVAPAREKAQIRFAEEILGAGPLLGGKAKKKAKRGPAKTEERDREGAPKAKKARKARPAEEEELEYSSLY